MNKRLFAVGSVPSLFHQLVYFLSHHLVYSDNLVSENF